MRNKEISERLDRIERLLSSETTENLRKVIKGEIRSVLMDWYQMEMNSQIGVANEDKLRLENYGFKVFSQNDEDGILEELFNRIGSTNQIFVEFGIQTGLESNCHYLLHKGWKGLWIEGSKDDCDKCRVYFERPIKDGRLLVENAFINKDNIDGIISKNVKQLTDSTEIDLLSIDIDGNDYYVWKAIKSISPRVVVIEYNAKFPSNFEWVMEYDENHIWQGSDEMGASLKSFEILGRELGYQLVGTNYTGSNAFFVKEQLAGDKFSMPATSEHLYNPARYYLRYKSGHSSKKYTGR